MVDSIEDNGDSTPGDGFCDDGSSACTLRAAIEEANASPGQNTIHFNVPGGGVHTISPDSPLPAITDPVVIDGETQPDARCAAPLLTSALLIELDGSGAGAGASGLEFLLGDSAVRGLVINHFDGAGILLNSVARAAAAPASLAASGGVTVECNLIGAEADGSTPAGNGSAGVHIFASGNTIGGDPDLGLDNVIAYNGGDGVLVEGGTGNRITANSIYANAGLGIDLEDDGPTPNDPGDPDPGANKLQNYPEISLAGWNGSSLTIDYQVSSSTANSSYPLTVEFFLADADGQEGQSYLGPDTYLESEAGVEKRINLATGATITPNVDQLVAVATDADGNSSEFSPAQLIVGPAAGSLAPYLPMIISSPVDFSSAPAEPATQPAASDDGGSAAGRANKVYLPLPGRIFDQPVARAASEAGSDRRPASLATENNREALPLAALLPTATRLQGPTAPVWPVSLSGNPGDDTIYGSITEDPVPVQVTWTTGEDLDPSDTETYPAGPEVTVMITCDSDIRYSSVAGGFDYDTTYHWNGQVHQWSHCSATGSGWLRRAHSDTPLQGEVRYWILDILGPQYPISNIQYPIPAKRSALPA